MGEEQEQIDKKFLALYRAQGMSGSIKAYLQRDMGQDKPCGDSCAYTLQTKNVATGEYGDVMLKTFGDNPVELSVDGDNSLVKICRVDASGNVMAKFDIS